MCGFVLEKQRKAKVNFSDNFITVAKFPNMLLINVNFAPTEHSLKNKLVSATVAPG